jgi:uncharacterized protein YceK
VRQRLTPVALAVGVVLSGCASAGTDTEPTPSPSASSASVTVRGRVDRGVEAGCLVLRSGDGVVWLLLGGDRSALVPGREVAVRGVRSPAVVSTCQQGIPLVVRSVIAN